MAEVSSLKVAVGQVGSAQVGILQDSIFKVDIPQVQLG